MKSTVENVELRPCDLDRALNVVIQVDTREQLPLPISRFPVERIGLPVGDYGVRGFSHFTCPRFIVERKSLNDLAGSLGRDRKRFTVEIEKMRIFEFKALVIEAWPSDVMMHLYHSSITPEAVFGSLDALTVRCGLHIIWCGDPEGAAHKVESLAEKFARGIMKEYQRLTAA